MVVIKKLYIYKNLKIMGWIILIGVIFLVSLVIALLAMNSYYFDVIGAIAGTVAVVAAIVLFFMGISLINLDRSFDKTINEYELTKNLVESYNGGEYGNVESLTVTMLEINHRIAVHKAYVNNKWSGIWYSEKIANLEPLTFKKVE